MRIAGVPYRTIWPTSGGVAVLDQRVLPFKLVVKEIGSAEAMGGAIAEMVVRGAPLIGVAGAYGAWLALTEVAREYPERSGAAEAELHRRLDQLAAARPTAVNLRWAVERQRALLTPGATWSSLAAQLRSAADAMADEDVEMCAAMGEHGLTLIRAASERRRGEPVRILTHCNAGWLATIDWGTATAPIYRAAREGIPLHIWVDETRPRLQGAKLTAFELAEEGIPHTIIADNAGGHLMQRGEVDLCIVGTDRTTRCGDVANKIGTYLKALAAHHHGVPFYVAAPTSSIDWTIREGRDIPIEERSGDEVLWAEGMLRSGEVAEVRLAAPRSSACNPGFDVTPRTLVTGLITPRGVCAASETGLLGLYPEEQR